MTSRSRYFLLAVLLVFATSLGTLVRAEIGGLNNDGSAEWQPLGPWKFLIITDGPEPIGIAWQPFTAPSPGHAVLNAQGFANDDGPPSSGYNPVSALPIVTWSRNSPDGYDVVYSYLTATGWSPPAVLADSAQDELDPSIVIDPLDGTVHVFYWVDDSIPRVMHRQAPADLSAWSAPIQVSDSSDRASRPSGLVHGGDLWVVYEMEAFGPGQTPRAIVLARYDSLLAEFVPEVLASTHRIGDVHPEVRSHSGRFWVEWIDADNEIAWIRQDLQGQWEAPRYEPYSSKLELFLARAGLRLRAVTVP